MNESGNPTETAIRRRFARRPLTRFVWFHTIASEGVEPLQGISYSVDLSRGGIGIVATNRIEPGSLVMVQVVFDSDRIVVSAVCRVIHCRGAENEGNYKIGLEFVVLPPDSSGFITENFA